MALGENSPRANHPTRWLKTFSQWDGWLLALGGAVVLLGWSIGNESLKRVLPGLVAMNPVTALGFIIAGGSLLCFWQKGKTSFSSVHAGRMLAGTLVMIGALKLGEYLFGWHLSFDQMLFQNQIQGRNAPANQIAPHTAVNFLMSGIALWRLNSSINRFSRWAQNLSLVLLFVSLIPLVGYAYRASFLYSVGAFPMALHTATLFCFLAIGTLLAQSDHGVVAVFTSRTPGGTVARRLIPFAFGVPFMLGALSLFAERENFHPADLSVSMVVVGSFAAFTGLIWWNAIFLNRTDDKRRAAETDLQRAHDELEARVEERTASLNDLNQALQTRIIQQKRAEEKIREQAKLLDEAQDAIMVLDLKQEITFWNKGAERMYGWNADEALGKNAGELLFGDMLGAPTGFGKIATEGAWNGELQQITKGKTDLTVESRWTLVKDEAGKPKGILLINTDVTEKKRYEGQLLRSQRMESLGALASGIAHDLNNALAPVILGTELLRQDGQDEKERLLLLDTISASARRGTEMVKQIVSFARGSKGQYGPVQVSSLVKEMAKILHDTFPKFIAIESRLKTNLWTVNGDVTELHQVLLNLCVNARDAMPQGGQLKLVAENVTLNQGSISPEVSPGSYVMLSVTDTGTGIPPELLPRIFEPFFTTKTPDKGTGLGLSTVSGIIKHHRGFVQIESAVGKGTQFRVYLPAVESVAKTEVAPVEKVLPVGHGELILVMDDEQAVRELAKTTLENYGYRVVTAPNGLLGITCFGEYKDEIKAVISDTDMPFMGGLMAIGAIQKLKPDIRVIIASGGKRDEEQLARIDLTHLTTLNKPYTVEQLLTTVASHIVAN